MTCNNKTKCFNLQIFIRTISAICANEIGFTLACYWYLNWQQFFEKSPKNKLWKFINTDSFCFSEPISNTFPPYHSLWWGCIFCIALDTVLNSDYGLTNLDKRSLFVGQDLSLSIFYAILQWCHLHEGDTT